MKTVAIPNRLTRGLPMPAADLVLDSMADMTLAEIVAFLAA